MPRARSEPAETPALPVRKYKPRQLALGEGDKLVLDATGTIARVAEDGTRQTWGPGDPEWPRYAIRFGLHAPVATPNPHGRLAMQERSRRP
jgi:hypothetical protein